MNSADRAPTATSTEPNTLGITANMQNLTINKSPPQYPQNIIDFATSSLARGYRGIDRKVPI
jgi:hypothetical protein